MPNKNHLGILVAAIFCVIALAILFFPRGHPPAKSSTCGDQIRKIARMLYYYARTEGSFPPSEKWVERLDQYYATGSDKGQLVSLLKCPSDTMRSRCSYEINLDLCGRRWADIPVKDYNRTVLLWEKDFSGSHGWVVFLDGHAERSSIPSK